MELNKRYSIGYKSLSNSTFDYDFVVDDALFAAYESREVLGGNCDVKVVLSKTDSQLDVDVTIEGSVVCECDRCLEPCDIDIDYEGHLIVRLSTEEGEYDGEVMWLNPAEENLDLTQYIYESIILSLPYQRVHTEGECNPDMMARFAQVTAAELDAIEARAGRGNKPTIDEGDFNKLAALKALMQQDNEQED
ncbi:MAG: DUF177 domain-containing protein [Alistipes sp.]|nr:DUF177 domain-containing protein [Alistipes sp.]